MRRFSEPKRRAIGEEVNRLRKAGFIRELKEAEWVANPVMVPKKDTTALRMCIDYTGLNKHCPKDHFPLPRIDQIVDSTAGCDRLSFLDAYSGYNQIKLKREDQELTAFITPHGVFCYNVMTFGLKNAGATYQRCMQACLGEQIGRNIEVYIDDIVVKTKHAATLIDDLRETFDNLDKYKIKLNPKKCFFGVPGGQVLGYFISARGIEANPLKIKAILDMEPPKNLHQVQQLAGRLAALSRFIAKLGEKALPFYNLMKKSEKFEWTKEAQESFDNLKKILSTSPVLVTPLAHPQTNGQVERINGLIGDGLKKRLTGAEGAWVEELPSDSINPKSQSEDIVEEHPQQLAPSVGTLQAPDQTSADLIMSSTSSSAPPSPTLGGPVRFGSYEFTPHSDSSRSNFSDLQGNMEMTIGSVHYNVNAEGILQLLESPTSGSMSPSASSSLDLLAGLTSR
ncbi:hypothetical protein QYE76_021723 [Lolium multiflorum]|uniref:Reverse transcriptase domain-containing protein n=1 Tax=Lolium multiflorum TaxID=4521 RepID=A0AAD8VSH3_LOLMU|nr:hypothetical protein QYE76_021723 [Lolium multiflorum]